MGRLILIFTFFLFFLFTSCKKSQSVIPSFPDSRDLIHANTIMLNIAMEDAFPPPIASRVYVYPHIAYYITLRSFYPDSLNDISQKLNGLQKLQFPLSDGANPGLSSLLAFCEVLKKVVFSEHLAADLKATFIEKAKKEGISSDQIKSSEEYAEDVAFQIIEWINEDNYIKTRTMDRWTSSKKPGEWRETPPDYIAGLEPNWSKIRPLIINNSAVYKSTDLPVYSPDKNSEFYRMVEKVYLESESLDSAKTATAWYWDDNPNVSEHRGHLVTLIHKISPPGHWLSIISGISSKENSSVFALTKAYTFSSIAMFDGIISCWYEKYKTNLVRPVSYIQEFIDVNWQPLIQTPPFPEYTSGHSVISASAATVLESIYGQNYGFTDSTQILFGLEPRYFNNLQDAAWEVSLSRFYGGIHYYNGIAEGNKQGKFIGSYVLNKLENK